MRQFTSWFEFRGRLSRLGYWRWYLRLAIAVTLALLVGYSAILAVGRLGAILLLPIPLILVAAVAVTVRRLHDRGKSALWLLPFSVIPFGANAIVGANPQLINPWLALLINLAGLVLSIWGLVEIGFRRGELIPNRFGEVPADRPLALLARR